MKRNLPLGVFFDLSEQDSFLGDSEFNPPLVIETIDPGIETPHHMGSNLKKKHIVWATIIIGVVSVLLIGRALQLQGFQGSSYALLASKNRERITPIVAERGLIFDANGVQLTKNIPTWSLALRPQHIPVDDNDLLELATELAHITGDDTTDMLDRLLQSQINRYESAVVKEHLDYETALKLHIRAADIEGIHVLQGSTREYVQVHPQNESALPQSASHIIGYLGKISKESLQESLTKGYSANELKGKTGLEYTYEELLRGTPGKRRVEVDAREYERVALGRLAPIPGKHIQLSLDIELQRILEQSLTSRLSALGKSRGAAIAMDPRTGHILASVSIPSYDNNDFTGGLDQKTYNNYVEDVDKPLFNRVISGTYPSGSTVKPAIAASALQAEIITPQTTFLSVGGIRVGQWYFPDWKAGGHGRVDVRRSLAESVNTFYYTIGGGYQDFKGLGVERLSSYLQRFGLSHRLGVDIPAEASGFIPSTEWKEETKNERWYIGDTYNLSIGQGDLLVTPLQIASMTSVVANGGTLFTPQFVSGIINPESQERTPVEPRVIREGVIDESHLAHVRRGMRDCVAYGSCVRLSSLPFLAAGKTGTAQWSNNKEPHAWFTSFAPYDSPEIVLTILIEEGESGTNAAPVALDFLSQWWRLRAR
jgi:penicillin-binding protein 2